MSTLLSIIILLFLTYRIYQIYGSNMIKFRVVRKYLDKPYLLSRNMYFTIFTICTAPIFLGSLSLLKYGLWFLTLIYLLLKGKMRIKFEGMTVAYMIFFAWLCCTMYYSSVPMDGLMMLIKFLLPMLFLWLGYSAINNMKDLVSLLKIVNVVGCVWCLVMGGFAATFIPPLYLFMMSLCSVYAGFADYLVALFIVPIILYWLTGEKKYIFCALWMVLSTVLQSVRTGMGGMMIVFVLAILLRFKGRAVPGVLFAGAMFLAVVLFVPAVNEKFFGDNAGKVSASDIVQGNAMSLDNMEMSGREYMWERVLDNCHYGNEILGGGLGSSGRFVKNYAAMTNGLEMMHNDYLQILCDTGYVGVALFIFYYLICLIKVAYNVSFRRTNTLTMLTGIMALSSLLGIAFCMYFDNVVSNSMQSMVIPYIYIGLFLKALDIERRKTAG